MEGNDCGVRDLREEEVRARVWGRVRIRVRARVRVRREDLEGFGFGAMVLDFDLFGLRKLR